MSNPQQLLFGDHSFLEFTLSKPKITQGAKAVLNNGTAVELLTNGVLSFQPKNSNQADCILLSAGVHGNETAPIEILNNLVRDILAGDIAVTTNLLIVLAHPDAINNGSRFINENMNRLFTAVQTELSASTSNSEQQRAVELMHYSQQFFKLSSGNKLHFDLHTAIRDSFYKKFAISPNPYQANTDQPAFSLLNQCGIESILITEKKSSTYSAYTARHCGTTSFTLELGKVKPFGENDLTEFSAITTCIQSIISGNVIAADHNHPQLFTVKEEVIRRSDSFRLCFAQDIANFTEFNVGEVLATDQDYKYQVKTSGERILFPNENVAIGQRALVIITPLPNQ